MVRHTFSLTLATLLLFSQTLSAGELNFAVDSASIAENGSTLAISIERRGTVNAAASVTVKSADGTAEAPADYDAMSNVLSWTASDLDPKTVNLSINDAALVEGDQAFTLELQNVVDTTIGSVNTLVVTISDYEEVTLQSSSESYFAEHDGAVSVMVARSVEFESALRSRLGGVAVQFSEPDLVDYSVVASAFAGFTGVTHLDLSADNLIRRVENFNTGMVGLEDMADVNGDGVNDFKMNYPNGEQQHFFTVEVGTR